MEILPSQIPEKLTDTLVRSCKTLMLYDFKEAYCNHNLTVLGNGTPEELHAAWQEIMFEYSALLKSDNSEYIFELTKSISLLQADIIYIENAVQVLRYEHSEEIVEQLRQYGFPLITGYKESDLERVISLAKTKVFELQTLVTEYELLQKTTNGKAQSEDDFDATIAVLCKYQGYGINQRVTSVTEFCAIFNLFLKSTNNGRRSD